MRTKSAIASVFLGLAALPLLPAAYAESGSVILEARCHVEVQHSHQFGEQTIKYYEQICGITNAAGSGFMHKVSMFGPVWSEASDSATRLTGHNVIVDRDKDEIYLSLAREGVPPQESPGRWIITGGTGKYAGATGNGTYELIWLPAVVEDSFLNIAILKGQYRIP
ncbi:MAG: hypothetical protein AMJ66_02465 [Betaproteobacteria bacterium SG8_40]|nr:MAG: hypothetical protein AMJ66_02465 [Betaproteobacteria bacterium SG8_40]